MDSHHNPDTVMTDEQLAAGEETITDLGDYVLEDLPDGVPPELNEEPAAKKQCGEGTSSGAAGASAPAAAPLVPQPMQRSNSSGSSAATAPSSSRPSAPPRPRSAPPSRPQPPVQEAAVEQPSAGTAANLSLSVRYRNLRRHRPSVGTELRSLTRDPLLLVAVMFRECSEEVRESILSRIAAALPGSAAFNRAVPQFDAATGEPLLLPRRTYFRHIYSWTSAADARIFRGLFAVPFLVRLNNSRPIEVKIYVDPYPEFSAAKARGDTYMVVRNVPLGVQPEELRASLLSGKTDDDLPWLADLLHFHRLKDPYDGSAYSQMLGLPVAAEGDPSFNRISAILWIPDQEEPAFLNISCHACTLCSSNHRLEDHACFAITRRNRVANRQSITMSALQAVNGKLLGQHASTAAFKKDPGLLLISLDLDVEVWACSICDFVCGIALDSAMFHLNSDQHRNRLKDPAHQNVSKDKYGACHIRIARAVNPTDEGLGEQLRAASQQFDKYEAFRAADIALKAKLKVEGPREMGVSSLLVGINSRIKASLVTSLQSPSGELVSDLPTMSTLCTTFFQDLYSASHLVRYDENFWSHVPPSQLPPHTSSRLALPFSMEEIASAISKLPRCKTPGPDGLTGELFRSFKTSFTPAIHSLFLASSSALPPTMLQGRTVLIPKKGDSTVLDNLRPITLMNSDYKILAICLASCLQPLLPSLIHHSQAAFIKSRKIVDTLNDTLDIFNWATTQKFPLLALTVDIRKAYDLVDREFMLTCLATLGLPPPFLRWVRLMHTNTTTKISVNNFCGPAIPVRSGVRQGCPLAPLLFLCVIEVFHRYASHFLPSFPISCTQRRLMSCYADDVTIFLNSDKKLQKASHVLLSFAAVSGEYPNRAKYFNPPPTPSIQAIDAVVGNLLSSSKYQAEGRTHRLLAHNTIYNRVEHGGLGAIRPTTQILALNAQRALRRFSHLPNAAVARELVPIPFGLHGFLLHKDFLAALPDAVPTRLRQEVRSLTSLSLNVLPPRPEFWCILAELVPFNPLLCKEDGRPFGRLKDEAFLLTEEVRIGHLVRRDATGARRMTKEEILLKYPPRNYPCSRRILHEIYEAMPDEWLAALSSSHSRVPLSSGDWVIMAADMHSLPRLAYEVVSIISTDSFQASAYPIDPVGRISKAAEARCLLRIRDTVQVLVTDRWLCGTFCSGAGLAARLEILHEGAPSLATIRSLAYTQQPLPHAQRWINILPDPGPSLVPDYTHDFLAEQPSSQRDVLFRLYARALPSGSRFLYTADKGICGGCNRGVIEDLPHLFFECGVAQPITAALQRTARLHMGISTPAALTLFPMTSAAGRVAP
ncbi:unnamed protein product [Closterium sp. Yama58-4]|nr:unnamed protein product [Closterium sp. Yama58-4]